MINQNTLLLHLTQQTLFQHQLLYVSRVTQHKYQTISLLYYLLRDHVLSPLLNQIVSLLLSAGMHQKLIIIF